MRRNLPNLPPSYNNGLPPNSSSVDVNNHPFPYNNDLPLDSNPYGVVQSPAAQLEYSPSSSGEKLPGIKRLFQWLGRIGSSEALRGSSNPADGIDHMVDDGGQAGVNNADNSVGFNSNGTDQLSGVSDQEGHSNVISENNDNITHPIDSNEKEKEKAELENISPAELVEKTLEREDLKERIEQAIDDCEFETTPEVQKAIGDYYKDHTLMMLVANELTKLESLPVAGEEFMDLLYVCGDNIVSRGLQQDIDNFRSVINKGGLDLSGRYFKGSKAEGTANAFLKKLSQPFLETGVGITTITDDEKALTKEINQKVTDWRSQMKLGGHRKEVSTEDIERSFSEVERYFWNDVRHAGDLLFHTTPFAKDVMDDGHLRTRSNQKKANKKPANMGTSESPTHAPAISWAEKPMMGNYVLPKSQDMRKKYKEEAHFTQILAMPIAEVVRVTPFGRGGEYATVGVKSPARRSELLDSIKYNSGVDFSDYGGGADSYLFPPEKSSERRFVADPGGIYSWHKPDYYYSYNIGEGVSYNGENKAFWIKFRDKYKEINGEGLAGLDSSASANDINSTEVSSTPTLIVADEKTPAEELTATIGEFSPAEKANIEETIRELNRRSVNDPQYKGEFVFRLRGDTGLEIPG